MAEKRLNKIIAFLLLLIVLLVLYFGIVGCVWFRKKEMPLQFYTQTQYLIAYDMLIKDYDNLHAGKTKEFCKIYIEESLGVKFYIYQEKEIELAGMCYPTIRLIIINEEANGYDYCLALAHEVMHLKKFIKQEDYICFETFKYLYEDKELHNVGVWYGLKQLNGHYSKEYDVSGLIVNYLTNK